MSGKMLKSGETSVAATAASPADSAKVTSVTRCTSTPTTAHASRFCDIARIARPVRVRATKRSSPQKITSAATSTRRRCQAMRNPPTSRMSASPAATMAYMAPSVRPCSSCSRRSAISVTWGPRNGPQTPKRSERPGPAVALLDHPSRSIEQGRARRQLFEDAQLAVAHLEQDHVDPGLVMVVELDRTERRVLDVDLLQRRADRLAIGVPLLLQRDLDRGHD